MRYPHLASRLFDTPLFAHPGKAAAALHGIGERIVGGAITVQGADAVEHVAFASGRPSMGVLGDELGAAVQISGRDPLLVIENVAVIPVEGTLVHKGKWIGLDSGETSYEGLQALIGLARSRRDVQGVVFEVDSYGGEVSGAFDAAGAIADLSAEKPTIAILTDYAFSAGYLLASAARQIVMPDSGGAGSIGVISVHTDRSKALGEMGLTVTVLSAGRHKAEGNPYEPLPKDVADRWRAELEDLRRQFAEAVSGFRGGRFTFDAAMATEADTYRGEAAVAIGLADAVMRPSDAFVAFIEDVNRAASPAYPKGSSMSTRTGLAAVRAAVQGEGQPSAETFIAPADHEAAVATARAEGERAGREAIKAESASAVASMQARCRTILASEDARGREDMAHHLAFETDMGADAAVALLGKAPKASAAPDAPDNRFERAMTAVGNPQIGPDLAAGGSKTDDEEIAEEAARIVATVLPPRAA